MNSILYLMFFSSYRYIIFINESILIFVNLKIGEQVD